MFYRSLSNRCLWLRHKEEIRELRREYPQLKNIGEKGKIPDPWDDYCRGDWNDRAWKSHRKTQYRIKKKHKRHPRPKVVFDTFWVPRGRWSWMAYTHRYGDGHYRKDSYWMRFRVRESYRRYRVDE